MFSYENIVYGTAPVNWNQNVNPLKGKIGNYNQIILLMRILYSGYFIFDNEIRKM